MSIKASLRLAAVLAALAVVASGRARQAPRDRAPARLPASRVPCPPRRSRRSRARPRASSRCRSTCSPRRTSTRTRRSGPTRATTAATPRARSSSPCGRPGRIGDQPADLRLLGRLRRRTIPRDKIVSPYPYKTAKAALRGAAGPGQGARRPDRLHQGHHARLGRLLRPRRSDGTPPPTRRAIRAPTGAGGGPGPAASAGIWGGINQASTIVSLLTPEYQKRYVQMLYHETVDNSNQWNASFCYPEGFIRWWALASRGRQLRADRHALQAEVHVRHRRQLPPRGADRPRARAEGAAVVRRDGRLLGRRHPGHLDRQRPGLDPAHHVRVLEQAGDGRDRSSRSTTRTTSSSASTTRRSGTTPRPSPSRCVMHDRFLRLAPGRRSQGALHLHRVPRRNIQNVNGHPKQLTKADPDFIDYYGRPWAQNWEKWFEKGWDKPRTTTASRRTCWTP